MSESQRKRRKKSRPTRRQLPADNEQELLIEDGSDEQETAGPQETHPADRDRMCLEEEDEEERVQEFSVYQWLPSSEPPEETAARLRHVVESGEHLQLFENLEQDRVEGSAIHGQ